MYLLPSELFTRALGKGKMKAYLGAKIILAEPMSDAQFNAKFKNKEDDGCKMAAAGYHVQYSNPNGTTYDAWSPKSVFERAYREVSEDEVKLINN